jgi:hypothetical protein
MLYDNHKPIEIIYINVPLSQIYRDSNISMECILEMVTTSVVEWPEFLATDPEVQVRFPVLPNFLRSSGSGTGSTQPR